MKHIVVIGGGLAGLAAAWSARSHGARVTLVSEGSSSTMLSASFVPRAAAPWSSACASFLSDLQLFEPARLVATSHGVLAHASLATPAMLDLAALEATGVPVVKVPRVLHAEWDAEFLAKAWTQAAFVEGLKLAFEATVLPLYRHSDERDAPWYVLAQRMQARERLMWLRGHVQSVGGAILLPPVLLAESASVLRGGEGEAALVVGEAAALPPSSFALSYERARARVLNTSNIDVVEDRVESLALDARSEEVEVQLRRADPLIADALIVCAGGLVAGGLRYASTVDEPALPSVYCPLLPMATVQAGSVRLEERTLDDDPETLFRASDGLRKLGVATSEEGRVAPRIYAAGEIRADAAHDAIGVIEQALRAGQAAVRAL